MSFDWRTGDDLVWDAPGEKVIPAEKRGGREGWRRLLLLLALALLLAWLVGRQVQQRAQQSTADVHRDVAAAHAVAMRAMRAGDGEMLQTVLSGRDPAWTQTQLALTQEGALLARPAFDLPAVQATAAPAITLSPDLQTAEATSAVTYLTVDDQPVTLQHTAVYRRGENRWLLAPPQPDFWGGWSTAAFSHLSLVYPQRDTAVARRLGADINAAVAALCLQYACAPGWRLQVRLSDEAAALTPPSLPSLLERPLQVTLPAPTLAGAPLDEAGYALLARAYRRQAATAVLAHAAGYDCCRHGLFFQALLHRQLANMDLQPWPLTAQDYQRLLLNGRGPAQAARAWLRPFHDEQAWPEVYALIDYLLPQAPAALPQMMRALNEAGSFDGWLAAFLPPDAARDFDAAALAFVVQRAEAAQPPQPAALPPADLLLACHAGETGVLRNVRYSFAREQWTAAALAARPGYRPPLLMPLPQGGGYVAYLRPLPGEARLARLELWREEERQLLLRLPHDEAVLWVVDDRVAPPADLLLLYQVNGGSSRYLLDLQQCGPEGCARFELSGAPLWSPDGRQTLLRLAPDSAAQADFAFRRWRTRLALGDRLGQAQTVVGEGNSPFWLADGRFGYVRLDEDAAGEPLLALVLASAHGGAPQRLLTTADLLAAIDEAERPSQLIIQRVTVHPQRPQTLIVTAVGSYTQLSPSFVFAATLAADGASLAGVTLLLAADSGLANSFSPDGRWLTVADVRRNSPWRGSTVYLLDMETGARATLSAGKAPPFVPLWSPDGRWFLQYRDDYLMLFSPQTGAHRVAPHDFSFCFSPVWLEN